MKKLIRTTGKKATGQTLWLLLGICMLTLVVAGCKREYAIDYAHLMYRNFESTGSGNYQRVIGISDFGGPVQESDIIDSVMTDSTGTSVIDYADGFYHLTFMQYDCTTGTCEQSGPIDDTGIWARYATLTPDTYNVQVNMVNEQVLTSDIGYGGQVILPYVSASTMQAQWNDTDLELSWSNPITESNWNEVDQLRIVLFDNNNQVVLQIRLAPEETSVTVPADLIAQSAALLGGDSLAQWQIQTRAYDENGMNFARGYSNTAVVSTPGYAIPYSYVMYRNYESTGSGNYMGVIAITDNSGPVEETDIIDASMTDSTGTGLASYADGFYHLTLMQYDCTTGTCSQSGPIEDTGIWASYTSLAPDTYNMQVEMENGQVLTSDVDYAGQLILPYVSASTMQAQWNGADLELSWSNPTADPNWNAVTQLRVVLFDNNNQTVLHLRLAPYETTATVPADLIAQSAALLGGTSLTQWQIQTRTYDSNGNNIARGYSNTAPISAPGYEVSYAFLMYRNLESTGSGYFQSAVGITDNGGPVQASDIIDTSMSDSSGVGVVPYAGGFYHLTFMRYNCTTGICSQSGPVVDSGIWARYATLAPDTYDMQIEMENGQMLLPSRDYGGQLVLPYVSASTMQAQWNGADLELSWSNPTAEPNWYEVNQLRIVLFDNNNQTVLQIYLAPYETTVTVPADLVAQSAALLGGTSLAQWQIQTRAYEADGMNSARGYSLNALVP